MKILVAKEHLLHKVQELLVPGAQFEKDQPDWSALFYVSQTINMSEDPVNTLNEVMVYLTSVVLPTSDDNRNYRVFENAMRLMYAMSITLTSIRCIERIFHDEALMNFIYSMATRTQKNSFFERMFVDTSQRQSSIAIAEQLLTLWTDLTMVYQEEFPVLWNTYRNFKANKPRNMILSKNSGERPTEEHDFDGLRLIMHNFDRQFVDVPIVSVQSDLPDERDWIMSARNNEQYKVYATAFVMKDMAASQPDEPPTDQEALEKRAELISKLTFMYHYCMNFRSKYTRELKTNSRRKVIDSDQHELGTSWLQSIAFALKEAKTMFDRKKIQIKG